MSDGLPEALKLARAARVAPDGLADVASPHRLWMAAQAAVTAWQDDPGGKPPEPPDARALYRHAMIEAGYMVPKGPGYQTQVGFEPCDPCPICNWSPNL